MGNSNKGLTIRRSYTNFRVASVWAKAPRIPREVRNRWFWVGRSARVQVRVALICAHRYASGNQPRNPRFGRFRYSPPSPPLRGNEEVPSTGVNSKQTVAVLHNNQNKWKRTVYTGELQFFPLRNRSKDAGAPMCLRFLSENARDRALSLFLLTTAPPYPRPTSLLEASDHCR